MLTFKCPECQSDNCSTGVIDNYLLIEKLSVIKTEVGASGNASSGEEGPKCSNDDNLAHSYCVECVDFICHECLDAHLRLKYTKDHTILSKDEARIKIDKKVTETKCEVHPQEALSFFCETCEKLTCRDCQLMNHPKHDFKPVSEVAKETREQLQNLLQETSKRKDVISKAFKAFEDLSSLNVQKKTEVTKEIGVLVEKILAAVNQRGAQLLSKLNEAFKPKLESLSGKKDSIQLLSDHTDHCINFLQNALDNGSDSAILSSKKTLTAHLSQVNQAEIPELEAATRVRLFPSNDIELQNCENIAVYDTFTLTSLAISVISRLGTILVDEKVYSAVSQGGPLPVMTPLNLIQQVCHQVDTRSLQPHPDMSPRPVSNHNENRGIVYTVPQQAAGIRNFSGNSFTNFSPPHQIRMQQPQFRPIRSRMEHGECILFISSFYSAYNNF